MFDSKLFGARLRKLRRDQEIPQDKLGQLLGVTATQVSDMEHGKTTTSMSRLYQLAQYFEVSSDYLLGLTDDPAPR